MLSINKEISYVTELQDFDHNTIIDSKVKPINIFTKELEDEKIAAYGEYDILIFYSRISKKKNKYEVKSIRKTFLEVFSQSEFFQDNDYKKHIEETRFQPTCKFNLKNKHHNSSYYEIEVSGNIQFNYEIDDNDNVKDEDVKYENEDENAKEENDNIELEKNNQDEISSTKTEYESEVLQFHENEGYSIEQLMHMDFDALKNISKKNKQ